MNSTGFGLQAGAISADFQTIFFRRKSLQQVMMRQAASSISAAVVVTPKLNLKALATTVGVQPMARSTGEGSLEPLAHAEPLEHATPA
jgi:hypothetical protein